MNYFEFYELPVSFVLDVQEVKRKFLERSKKYHPDFFVNEAAEQQSEMLELSTFNTRAYHALSDFDRRMQYILEMKNQVSEGERYELSPDFLMEMMDINEGLMELKEQPDSAKVETLRKQVTGLFDDLYQEVSSIVEAYREGVSAESDLKKIKDYHYRKKYLLRIQQSLDTFAAHS